MSLPTFFTPPPSSFESQIENGNPVECIFEHSSPLGSSPCLWWRPTNEAEKPNTVLILVPGNPGLANFYTPFLSFIHSSKSDKSLAILAHTHVGYTGSSKWPNLAHIGLTAQITALLEIVDALRDEFGLDTKLVLAAHSMGAWLSTQVLKERPEAIASLILLFPTISDIAQTPNGRALSWLFRKPLPSLVAHLSRLAVLIPQHLLSLLFPAYPTAQLAVLRSLITSPGAVYTSLTLAHEEMLTIRDLEHQFLHEHAEKLHLYFAEEDRWVGDEREKIMLALEGIHSPDGPAVKVMQGEKDIPHAFCINHGKPVASQCIKWLQAGSLL